MFLSGFSGDSSLGLAFMFCLTLTRIVLSSYGRTIYLHKASMFPSRLINPVVSLVVPVHISVITITVNVVD